MNNAARFLKDFPRSVRLLKLALLTFSLAVCAQAQTVTILAQRQGNQGGGNARGVIQATDGNFYGAADGGAYSQGQIFRMTPAGELTTIYSFCAQANCSDGEQPYVSPILGSDGNLYGVVKFGGNSTGSGTFYKLTLDGQLTTLHTFCASAGCVDGQIPNRIIQAADGNFYGTTELGGAHNEGVFFQISLTGGFHVLHSFC